MTTTTISWTPWAPDHTGHAFHRDQAIHLAERWLENFGLGLLPDSSSHPDAWADLDDGRFAFRFDSCGKSVAVFVRIEYDGAPDGHDTCQSVDVRRCEVGEPPPAYDPRTGRWLPW